MLDLDAIRKRAAVRASVACPAIAAYSLPAPISNVAALATVALHWHGPNPLLSREDADRCHWPAWTGEEIDRTAARIDLFLRRGIGPDQAEHLAERLLLRDREGDARVSCADCRHYKPGRCSNHWRAGLQSPDVGRDLAVTLQHCPGFAAQYAREAGP
jgi:hypothetical protein